MVSPVEALAGSAGVEVLGLALVHFLWQGAIVGLVTAVGLHLLRGASPNLRYGVACLGLAVLVALPVVTALRVGSELPRAEPAAGTPNVTEMARIPGERAPSENLTDPTWGPGAAARSPSGETTSWWREHRGRLLPWLVLGWLAGVLALSLRHLGGWLHVRRRVLRRVRPMPEAWTIRFGRVRSRIGLSRAVRAVVAAGLETPVVVGWLRPTIVVPVGLLSGMPSAEVEAILAHELAHVKRFDYAVNLIQLVAETLFFFHPAVWWISSEIRRERERCCDEMAAAACGSRRTCARALARLAGVEGRVEGGALAASGRHLIERIRCLSDAGPPRTTTGGWMGALGVVFALTLVSAVAHGLASPAGSGSTGMLVPPIDTRGAGSSVSGPRPPVAEVAPDTGIIQTPAHLGSLRERWKWAVEDARRHDNAWIGWGLADVAGSAPVVSNSPGGPPHDDGPRLRSYLEGGVDGPLPRVVLLFGVTGSRPGVSWARLRELSMPTELGGWPLYWLGSPEDRESLDRLERLLEATPDPAVRKEMAAALSLHGDSGRAVPAVGRVLRRDPSELVRAEAVTWLERQPANSAARLLRATVAGDASPLVREEALSSLEDHPRPQIPTWLASFATGAPEARVRAQASEALGERGGSEAVPVLERLVSADAAREVREAALEALSDVRGAEAGAALRRLASDHRDPSVRARAREELADRATP